MLAQALIKGYKEQIDTYKVEYFTSALLLGM
jgi:hypothetical protein